MGKRILVIEDHDGTRFVIYLLLDDAGFEIDMVEGGYEGPQIVETVGGKIVQADLIICDYHFSPYLNFGQVREMAGDTPLLLQTSLTDKLHSVQLHKRDLGKELIPTVNRLLGGTK